MIIRPPSLHKTWDTYWSQDPAFTPTPTLSDEPTPEEKAAGLEYLTKLRSAKNTGDWSELVLAGKTPTKFVMGQVDRNVWRALIDRSRLPPDSKRHVGQSVAEAILFRLSVQSIEGLDIKFKRAADPQWDEWDMAPASLINALDEIDPGIVSEIGNDVYLRLRDGIRPL